MARRPWHASDGSPLPNRHACRIGWHTSRRLTPAQIAADVGCGLTGDDIVRFWAEVGMVPPSPLLPGVELVPVMLSAKDRTRIAAEAKRRGVDMPDLAGEALSRMVRDNLFAAVLDR